MACSRDAELIQARTLLQPGAQNYTLARAVHSQVPGALIVLSVRLGNGTSEGPDLFVQNMVSDDASLDAFLASDAVGDTAVGNTSYLFLAEAPSDSLAAAATAALQSRLSMRAAAKSQVRLGFGQHFAEHQMIRNTYMVETPYPRPKLFFSRIQHPI
eukprot:SAG31_NODE_4650_length_3068_cov_2.827888_3_plen_157_part_00